MKGLKSLLITGGAGFIGSTLVCKLVTAGLRITNVDRLTYAGDLRTVAAVADRPNYTFIKADVCDFGAMAEAIAASTPDAIVHLAAESHVDRSIDAPRIFIQTNLVGTGVLLDAALAYHSGLSGDRAEKFRFIHVSTDEVFGELDAEGSFNEKTPYRPRSPYAASKAGADHLARAWSTTYGLPVIVTNCTNNYGPYQFPEKLIPTVIGEAIAGRPIPVYGEGFNVRDWLHVDDHVEALVQVAINGVPGETYNIGADNPLRNIDLVKRICVILDDLAPRTDGQAYDDQIVFVPDRPGHDFRYAIDHAKITRTLGWRPRIAFDQGLHDTVAWYLEHREWLERWERPGNRLGLRNASPSAATG